MIREQLGLSRRSAGLLRVLLLALLAHPAARAEHDALHGRFMQRDPLEYVDGMNLYEYVGGNPVTYVDPQGTRIETQDVTLRNGKVIRHFYDVFRTQEQIYLGYVIYDSGDETEKAYVDKLTTNREALSQLSTGAEIARGGAEMALRFNPVSNIVEVTTGNDIVTGNELGIGEYALAVVGVMGPLDELGDLSKVGKGADAAGDAAKTGRGIWDLGWARRGNEAEKLLGKNLPDKFPTIDKFEAATGTATSIKSLDITAKTYCDLKALESKVKRYIDNVGQFKNGSLGQVVIREDEVKHRALQLAIPPKAARIEQYRVLQNLQGYARQRGVKLSIHEIE